MGDIFDQYEMSSFFRMKDSLQQEEKFSKYHQFFVRQRGAVEPQEWATARAVPGQEAEHNERERDFSTPPSRENNPTSLAWLTRNLLGSRKDFNASGSAQRYHPGRSYVPVETEESPLDIPKEIRREEVPPKAIRNSNPSKPGPAKVLVGGVIQDAPVGFLGPRPFRRRYSLSLGRQVSSRELTNHTPNLNISTMPLSIANYSHDICQGIMRSSTSFQDQQENYTSPSLRSANDVPPSEFTQPKLTYNYTPKASEETEKCRPTSLLLAAASMALSGKCGRCLPSQKPSPPPPLQPIEDPAAAAIPTRNRCPPVIGAFRKRNPDIAVLPNITLTDAQAAAKHTLPGLKDTTRSLDSCGGDFSMPSGASPGTTRQRVSSRTRSVAAVAAAAGMGEPPIALTKGESLRSREKYLSAARSGTHKKNAFPNSKKRDW